MFPPESLPTPARYWRTAGSETPSVFFTVFHPGVRAPRGEGTPHSKTWIVDQVGRSGSPVRAVFATTTLALDVNFRGFNVALCLEILV